MSGMPIFRVPFPLVLVHLLPHILLWQITWSRRAETVRRIETGLLRAEAGANRRDRNADDLRSRCLS